MKVLVAPDKFKGTLTADQVAQHLGRGLAARSVEHRALPLADGGDGRPHAATVAVDGATAVIEVANTCGLQTLPAGTRAPLRASSRGLGEAVRAALALGTRTLVLALGGSAGTDGGAGLLAALGAVFRDGAGRVLPADGGSLPQIRSVDLAALPDLRAVDIVIACDVRNPLTGPDGAAAVYGPQKGADPRQVRLLDAGLAHLARQLDAERLAAAPGAGAAGGVGFAALLLGGRVVSGADYFLDLLRFDEHRRGCDVVITGEGRIDDQTRHGKLPAVVAGRAAPTPVVAVVGRNDLTAPGRAALGLHAVHAVAEHATTDPARDPELTARVLSRLGRTIPLPEPS